MKRGATIACVFVATVAALAHLPPFLFTLPTIRAWILQQPPIRIGPAPCVLLTPFEFNLRPSFRHIYPAKGPVGVRSLQPNWILDLLPGSRIAHRLGDVFTMGLVLGTNEPCRRAEPSRPERSSPRTPRLRTQICAAVFDSQWVSSWSLTAKFVNGSSLKLQTIPKCRTCPRPHLRPHLHPHLRLCPSRSPRPRRHCHCHLPLTSSLGQFRSATSGTLPALLPRFSGSPPAALGSAYRRLTSMILVPNSPCSPSYLFVNSHPSNRSYRDAQRPEAPPLRHACGLSRRLRPVPREAPSAFRGVRGHGRGDSAISDRLRPPPFSD